MKEVEGGAVDETRCLDETFYTRRLWEITNVPDAPLNSGPLPDLDPNIVISGWRLRHNDSIFHTLVARESILNGVLPKDRAVGCSLGNDEFVRQFTHYAAVGNMLSVKLYRRFETLL